MLEVYSTDIDVAVNSAIPFNNVHIQKGCSAVASAPATIQLNKCGVYKVCVDASASAETTIELSRDGVLQPEAQSTGTSLSYTTLVQVPFDNTCSCCSRPTLLQVVNTGAAVTFTNINVVVTKIC